MVMDGFDRRPKLLPLGAVLLYLYKVVVFIWVFVSFRVSVGASVCVQASVGRVVGGVLRVVRI